MYNLVRVIKSFVATDGLVKLAIVSTHGLFYDIGRELITWACLGGTLPQRGLTLKQMRPCLQQLLRGSWDAVAYTKASDKKPQPKRPRKPVPGGHLSCQSARFWRNRLSVTSRSADAICMQVSRLAIA